MRGRGIEDFRLTAVVSFAGWFLSTFSSTLWGSFGGIEVTGMVGTVVLIREVILQGAHKHAKKVSNRRTSH